MEEGKLSTHINEPKNTSTTNFFESVFKLFKFLFFESETKSEKSFFSIDSFAKHNKDFMHQQIGTITPRFPFGVPKPVMDMIYNKNRFKG